MSRLRALLFGSFLAASSSCGGSAATSPGALVDLPFGLVVVEGTEPIGRPAVFEEPAFFHNGEPVAAQKLRAAFWVTSDDPAAAVRSWVDQLDRLALDEVTIQPGHTAPEQWIQVTGTTRFVLEQPSGDYADIQLWETSPHPVLLVSIDKIRGDPRRPDVRDDAGAQQAPARGIEESTRAAGDVLFIEQSNRVHLPPGSEALMPTIPTFCGTGGSASVLAAQDGGDAVRALLDEAAASQPYAEVNGPVESVFRDTHVVTGSFVVPAGGWSFQAVAVQELDDALATVYVSSCAD